MALSSDTEPLMTDQLVRNGQVVRSLGDAVARGMASIPSVPGLLRSVIEKDMWRERVVTQTGEIARFDTFEAFVSAYPPEGLGTTVAVLESICREHGPDVVAKMREVKSALNPNGTNQHSGDSITTATEDRGANYKLARLKRDYPDLAQAVIEGKLSAHAAAVEAGFANPKVSINLRNLESAAGTICRKLDRYEVLELIARLYDTLGSDD